VISRDRPQLFTILALPSEGIDEPSLLRDLPSRIVSRGTSGAFTALASVPADWRASGTLEHGRLDVLVLAGELNLLGRRLGAGSFATLPGSGVRVSGRAKEEATVLAFWDPDATVRSAVLYSTSAWDLPWETVQLPGVSPGLMLKRLREEDLGAQQGPAGGWIRLVHAVPGWRSTAEERHVDCWEENILLHGDMYMTRRGQIRAGDCLANPPGLWHGPMATRSGALFAVHCDRPMNVEWRPSRSSQQGIDRYLRAAAWPDPDASVDERRRVA
jgi:hypothetical protein